MLGSSLTHNCPFRDVSKPGPSLLPNVTGKTLREKALTVSQFMGTTVPVRANSGPAYARVPASLYRSRWDLITSKFRTIPRVLKPLRLSSR